MFLRMYLMIVSLLVVSTGVLLSVLGVAVYRELHAELQREGRDALQFQVSSVEDYVHDKLRGFSTEDIDLRDGRGQFVYFYAITDTEVISPHHSPVPLSVVEGSLQNHQFETIRYHGTPYRVYKTAYSADGRTIELYQYSLMTQEESMLYHAAKLMWTVGGVGFVVALIGNLFLAQRLMRPTYRTWNAYHDSVLQLSHELQTPLATVNAMLASRHVDHETAVDVRREIARASHMVSDMLFLSKLRSGIVDRPTEPVAVSDSTEELAERYRELAENLGIKLVGQAEDSLFVETTPGEWERLVSTLFKNVIDHADPATEAVWSLAADGRYVCFKVSNQPKNPGDKRSPEAPERGVGLQIVSKLAQKMRGSVDIQRGATEFSVTVKVRQLKPHW